MLGAGSLRDRNHVGTAHHPGELPGGRAWATNEVLYNLSRERGIPTMAYSTIEQGRLRSPGALEEVAKKRGARPYPIALAWVMRRPDVIAIPKASGTEHVRENRRAVDIVLVA